MHLTLYDGGNSEINGGFRAKSAKNKHIDENKSDTFDSWP